MDESIRITQSGDVLEIRLNQPKKLNALDVPHFRELRLALQSAALDPRARAVVLTGEGGAFCAGGDVAVMDEYRSAGRLPQLFHELTGEQELSVREIVSMPKPVVASLPGVAEVSTAPSVASSARNSATGSISIDLALLSRAPSGR